MMRRRLTRLALGLLAGAIVIVGAANAVVALGGRGWTRDPAAARPAQAALVLGAQVQPDGQPSAMLEDRVRAAAALYRDRRVAKVLVSGDHGTVGYDEVGTMRRRLLSLGVPAQDIFEDHAGFDTWDSAQRAKLIFDVKSAVVVTQVEVQECATRGLGDDELAGALLDLGRVAQSHPQPGVGRGAVEQASATSASISGEIAPLTGPGNRSDEASSHIRALADEKLPHIEALIARGGPCERQGARGYPFRRPIGHISGPCVLVSAGTRHLERVPCLLGGLVQLARR